MNLLLILYMPHFLIIATPISQGEMLEQISLMLFRSFLIIILQDLTQVSRGYITKTLIQVGILRVLLWDILIR